MKSEKFTALLSRARTPTYETSEAVREWSSMFNSNGALCGIELVVFDRARDVA